MDLSEITPGNMRRHPWELARADFFSDILQSLPATLGDVWLDVGSGDAWLAEQLAVPKSETRVTCWDINYAQDTPRGDHLFLTRTRPRESFDLILMLDVLEHVEEDQQFVQDVVRDDLAPDGWILVSVPAHMSLFSQHDVALSHYRRYAPKDCRKLLQRAGLVVEWEGGLFHALAAVRYLQVLAERRARSRRRDHGIGGWDGSPLLTAAIRRGLHTEMRVSRALGRRRLVVPGLTYWALCRAQR